MQATFKAVLIAVYMTYRLQTKCKTCFGGTRMILHVHLKILFQNKGLSFYYPPRTFGLVWLVVLDLVGFDCVGLAGCVRFVSKALCGNCC